MIIHASHQRHIYFCETGDLATVNSLKICILSSRTYIYVHYSSALDTNQNRENNIWKITSQINGIIIRQLSAVVVCAIWGTILKTSFLILNTYIYPWLSKEENWGRLFQASDIYVLGCHMSFFIITVVIIISYTP